ncbi:STIV orfB116 family protein [Gelria sp. Kuro-4]|uniref:STIV orfB116 family protein n=1 Tax=Gelria sp. Kuro-4 TaxID=2796927 RepID=UPI001BEF0CD0|nr:DUF1874 domain-containing protein [Gelria sp. Kuro-4]BCV23265.1 hypothetical protein kuro4_00380 [Gelria sp. Kuro-4]
MYLCNAFSGSMLSAIPTGEVRFCWISEEEARQLVRHGFVSAVGHPGTAQVFTSRFVREIVEPNRKFVQLKPGDSALIGQVMTRLPEGKVLSAEELQGVEIRWLYIEVYE